MRKVCSPDEMPSLSTVFKWIREIPEFSQQYARATEERTEFQAEELLDISDNAPNVIVGGEDRSDNARVQAERVRVDTRKWLMSKMKPKKYGDKIDMTTNGKDLPVPIYNSKSQNENEATG